MWIKLTNFSESQRTGSKFLKRKRKKKKKIKSCGGKRINSYIPGEEQQQNTSIHPDPKGTASFICSYHSAAAEIRS